MQVSRSARRFLAAGIAVAITLGGFAALNTVSGPARAFAGTTNGSETVNLSSPYSVAITNYPDPDQAAGVGPQTGFGPAVNQGVVTGSGYTPGSLVYLEICDGTPPTTPGYSTAAHCVNSNSETIVPASGNFSIPTAQPSFQYEIFHGADLLDDRFNCLAPGDDPTGETNMDPNTGMGTTAVGGQPIDPELPSWGSSRGANTNLNPGYGGGSAPCQLRIGVTTNYTSNDIYLPLTNLDGLPPSSAPGAPGTPTVTPGPAGTGDASVAFTAASGSPTTYTVTATNTAGGANTTKTASGVSSPVTITGLTPGATYTFAVTATNSAGTGPSSASSGPVLIPTATIPGAPGQPTVTPGADGSGAATVTFTAPTTGSPATTYTVTAVNTTNSADSHTASGPTTTVPVSGLTPGQTYSFTVTAANAAGTGPASAATTALIPLSQAPLAPTITALTAGPDGSGTVSVTVTAASSGPTATGFTVTATDEATSATVVEGPGTSPVLVSGLTPGDTYTFVATATGAEGTSPPSASSVPLTVPAVGVPEAPTVLSVVSGPTGSGTATVSFAAAGGGAQASGFTVSAFDQLDPADTVSATVTASPVTLTGLTPGQSYTFSVTASNDAGTSAPGFYGPSVLVAGDSGVVAPSIVARPTAAVAGRSYAYQLVLGGSPAPYVVLVGALPSGLTLSSAGLISGRTTRAGTYRFSVQGFNAAGSAQVGVTLRVEAGRPAALTIELGNHQRRGERSSFGTLRVALHDRYGNPVSGVRVTFRVISGPAAFAHGAERVRARTSATGDAGATGLRAGARRGAVRVAATAGGLRQRVFDLTVRS